MPSQELIDKQNSEPLKSMRAAYLKWEAAQRQRGVPLMAYAPPCCGAVHHTPFPAEGERQWDSLWICAGCGEMFMKIVTHDAVRLLKPEGV